MFEFLTIVKEPTKPPGKWGVQKPLAWGREGKPTSSNGMLSMKLSVLFLRGLAITVENVDSQF